MNIGRLQRSLMPDEKRMKVPQGPPRLPLKAEDELKKYENFLKARDQRL